VNGKFADVDALTSLPQGNIFGPIAFVFFINDKFTCVAKIFGDDTKLFHGIISPVDHLLLHDDLNQQVD